MTFILAAIFLPFRGHLGGAWPREGHLFSKKFFADTRICHQRQTELPFSAEKF